MRVRFVGCVCVLAAALAAFTLLPLAWSQSTSSLSGRITDPSGEAIPAAQITLLEPTTGLKRSASSDVQGEYNFAALTPGHYQLTVTHQGFATTVTNNVELLVNVPSTVNVALKLATVATTVEVTATAPLVNHVDATIGNALDQEQIKSLPMPDRNVVQLLAQQPGVVFLGTQPGIAQSSFDTRSGAVNGIRSDQSNVTLDGVDVNDQLHGYAFTSVLNVPPDSLQEFRITTAGPTSSAGHSAGAQAAMVTKSGTNQFHGSLYEYNRNTALSANDTFLKASQMEAAAQAGQNMNAANQAAPLIRNVYGFTFGGPALKDKLFFFTNYEGRQDRESQVETREVPTDSMRAGNLEYLDTSGNTVTLTPAQIASLGETNGQPAAVAGVDPAMVSMFNSYPEPNSSVLGDGLNTAAYVFASPIPAGYDTYIARVDYHISPSETLFARGETENFKLNGAQQFPGEAPNQTSFNDSRGLILGLTSIFSPTLVNNFHYGFIRQGGASVGPSTTPEVSTRNLDQPNGIGNYSRNWTVPDNNIIDDLTWSRGDHTFEFGTDLDLSHTSQLSTENSYSSASLNGSWMQYAGFANVAASAYYPQSGGFPGVQHGFFNDYDYAMIDLLGAVTEYDATYNYTNTGATLPQGAPILRDFAVNNYGFFAQDQWHLTPNLVLTSGLRWSYQQPPSEVNGNQVYACVADSTGTCSNENLNDWFQNTGQLAQSGLPASDAGQVAFELGGPANHGPAMWNSEWGDFAPRIGVAWSPNFGTGWLSKIFGAPGQFSIRGGYDLLYEHFGNAIVNTFSNDGSIGLTSQLSSAEGIPIADAPRFSCSSCLPASLQPAVPPGGFPQVPGATFGNIAWGMNSSLRTPYVHELDFSLTRQLGHQQSLSVSYVGTFGRHLPMQEDLAQPADLVDPSSHTDYYSAARALDKLALANTPVENVQAIPFWQHFFSAWNGLTSNDIKSALGACSPDTPAGPLNATQAMYEWWSCNVADDTTALFSVDIPGSGLPAPTTGFYSFTHAQYGSLYAWNNIGTSNYNALQATYQARFGNNLQATINYTWSHALDEASDAERNGAFDAISGAIVNAWDPYALYADADFNMAQQINANWVWALPFGRGQMFGGGATGLLDQIIGGWHLSGDFLMTSGLPATVSDGQQWSTDWQLSGEGVLTAPITGMQTTYATQGSFGQGPNLFANPGAVFNDFASNLPGQSGTRNPLVGNGNFGIDTGLDKTFSLGESKTLGIGWEAFNLTNTVRYDVNTASLRLDHDKTFGNYTSSLTQPRFMQLYLRFSF
ncbi:MAG: TonB-dependent receptor domain-containing protein [Terriglobales bacterium]